jgi:hypothetical protein
VKFLEARAARGQRARLGSERVLEAGDVARGAERWGRGRGRGSPGERTRALREAGVPQFPPFAAARRLRPPCAAGEGRGARAGAAPQLLG